MTEPARPFFIPMIGIVALFAALGPGVGGAMFIPLSVVFKPTITPDTIALLVLIAALFGHAVGLIAAYVVGIGPAAATGFLYALWDAAAPERWPRALVAALIGGLIAYGLALRLAPLGASLEMAVDANTGSPAAEWIDAASPDRIGVTLGHAFVACGAIAGLVCALAANLLAGEGQVHLVLDAAQPVQQLVALHRILDLEHHRRDQFAALGDERVVGGELVHDLRLAAALDRQHLVHLVPHGVEILEIECRMRADLDAAVLLERADALAVIAPFALVAIHRQDVGAGQVAEFRHRPFSGSRP